MFSNDNIDQCLEIFCLIWLESNPSEGRNTEQKLRSFINQVKKFDHVQQCHQYIRQTSAKDRLVLIVKGVFVDIDELISKIADDHRTQKKIEEPLAINIFAVGGQAVNPLNGKFVFTQILIDCLLRLKSTDQDKNELIQLLNQHYQGNQYELDNINEFQINYQSNQVLKWYTKESFFYKTLNSVLRTVNIHMIFLYRSFIFDIQQQLQKHQSNQILKLYRAQIISNEELNNLKKSINQYISINSFFSTSVNYYRALSFFYPSKSMENTEKILFEIEANSNVGKTKPFADISHLADYPEEKEVLFMIGVIFRLKDISFDHLNQFWIIKMSLSSDEENDLKQVLIYMKQQIDSEETNLRILSKILSKMGQFQLAGKYLERLLNQLSSHDPLIADLYEDLGEIASQSGDFDKSMEWHQKLIAFKEQHPTSSSIQSNDQSTFRRPQSNLKWKQHATTVAGGNDEGTQSNQLCNPRGIYVDDDQQVIYIADRMNHRIVKWQFGAENGQVIAGGNGQGGRIDQLFWPRDVIVDQKTKSLIICDQGNGRIIRCSIENPEDRQIIISNVYCYGLMGNNDGDLFVSDCIQHEVKRWRKGEKEGTVVAGGNGKGNQLNSPCYIFVDRNDTVYVSDCNNHRVMRWVKGAKEGLVVAGGQGQGNSFNQLSKPEGVVVDDVGDVYVADTGNHRIMCWLLGSKESRHVVGEGIWGQKSNQLSSPTSLSFDRQNNLYVVDCLNNRIQRFDVDHS